MNIELRGTLKTIFTEQKINDNLSKKEIVVTIDEDTKYPQDIICQAVNQKIDMLKDFQMGDKVAVKCDLRGKGNKDGRYFNNLSIWEINQI